MLFLLLIPVWFVFGFFAVRLAGAETIRHKERLPKPGYLIFCFLGGALAWLFAMADVMGDRARRNAHFIPKAKYKTPKLLNSAVLMRAVGLDAKSMVDDAKSKSRRY